MHWAAYDFEPSSIHFKLRSILTRTYDATLSMCGFKSTITVDQLIDTLSYTCDNIAQDSIVFTDLASLPRILNRINQLKLRTRS